MPQGITGKFSRVGMHCVTSWGCEGRVKHRRNADDDHVARCVDRLVPVCDNGVVASRTELSPFFIRSFEEVVAAHPQVHMHEALALRQHLSFLYEFFRQGSIWNKPERIPNACVRDNRPQETREGQRKNGQKKRRVDGQIVEGTTWRAYLRGEYRVAKLHLHRGYF